ncbi:MAG: hypothetical protein NWS46_05805 [Cyclobacteriaceae bacterium]|nr:hypothetical protein [Cyclobacteriaceae bacterium]
MTLLVPDEDASLMNKITKEINDHSKFEISVISMNSLTEVEAIDAVLNTEYDLTTVDNTINYSKSKSDIRTIIPFFHEVMVVLSRHQFGRQQIDSLLTVGDYLVLAKETEELNIYIKMIPNYTGLSTLNYRLEDHFDIEKDLKEHNLLIFFSDRENKEVGKILFDKKAFIYSLDEPESRGKGSFLEGFCKDYKKTTPYMLPRHAFGIVLEEPVYTMAVHELLVARSDMPTQIVYDLMETFHHHHIVPIFESYNNYTFESNQQDINLSFPFHMGTIDYMNRDQPKFVERYADVMGFVLSACVLIIGLIATLKATINQRKKDRMDEYYKELIELKEKAEFLEKVNVKRKLRELQKKVFGLLIDEKLSANNEFVIFMMLWEELDSRLGQEFLGTDHKPNKAMVDG